MASDHSVGDRVEVLREQKLYAAKVLTVHATGQVDVAYDFDGSVGYLLSVAEHGLNKMWMPEKKGKGGGGENAKVCLVDGCSNAVRARGLCGVHGRKPCSIEGCTTKADARGVCGNHGSRGKCVKMGCATNARKRGGHCSKHTQKVACAAPNCSKAHAGDVCCRHGAKGKCAKPGCTTNAEKRGCFCRKHGGYGDFCVAPKDNTPASARPGTIIFAANAGAEKEGLGLRHSKERATCSTAGCNRFAKGRGRCAKHGVGGFCSTDGCDSGAVKRGLCKKHGAYGVCVFPDCNSTAQLPTGVCSRHGGGSTKVCRIEGCKTLARSRGRCSKHGANGWCKSDGCTTPAFSGSEPHCHMHGGGKKKKPNKPCSVAGCTTRSTRRGLCWKHGGRSDKCWIPGCTNRKYGVLKICQKHGGSGYCLHPSGCITPALKYGANCWKHTKKEKKD
eukprot:gene19574-biopygen9469